MTHRASEVKNVHWKPCPCASCICNQTFQTRAMNQNFAQDVHIKCQISGKYFGCHPVENVHPALEGDTLEGCQHCQHKVVEVGDPKIWSLRPTKVFEFVRGESPPNILDRPRPRCSEKHHHKAWCEWKFMNIFRHRFQFSTLGLRGRDYPCHW